MIKSQWWHLCKIFVQDSEQITLQPIARHATRQWALDALLTLYRDKPEDGPYAIVETNNEPAWDPSSYGPRQQAGTHEVGGQP
jgi:hypothetical protein